MDLLKCACGCDKLNKDELGEIIKSTHKVENFLKNREAVEMFKRMFETTPKPNAVLYLEYINIAKGFMENPSCFDATDDLPGTLMGRIDQQFAVDPSKWTNDDASNRELLEQIINYYSVELYRTKEYEKFQEKLKNAYLGRATIKKSN